MGLRRTPPPPGVVRQCGLIVGEWWMRLQHNRCESQVYTQLAAAAAAAKLVVALIRRDADQQVLLTVR